MAVISQEILDEVEKIKEQINWSWLPVQRVLGWSPYHLTQFRALRMAMPDDGLRYLRELGAAFASVRPYVPAPEHYQAPVAAPPARDAGHHPPAPLPHLSPRDPVTDGLAAAGYHPVQSAAAQTTEIRVMILDDMASKIADRYRWLQNGKEGEAAEMSTEERAGAIWMLGQVAADLGVKDKVAHLLSQHAAPAPRPEPPPAPAPWSVPGITQPERRPLG